jgi:hypothetical protein
LTPHALAGEDSIQVEESIFEAFPDPQDGAEAQGHGLDRCVTEVTE